MKIQYASDLHLEFNENWRILSEQEPLEVCGDILVLAGDIGYLGDDTYTTHPFWDWASKNYQQVLVALGNHEFYKHYDLTTLSDGQVGEIRPNVHYYYNKVVRIEDIDFIISTLWSHIPQSEAAWTEHSVSDFYRIRYGEHALSVADFNCEHQRCLSFLKQSVSESDAPHKVVVTHHVPSSQLVAPEFLFSTINSAFMVNLSYYIESSAIDYWIYGHSHCNIDKTIGSTRCVSNQFGYSIQGEHLTFDKARAIEI